MVVYVLSFTFKALVIAQKVENFNLLQRYLCLLCYKGKPKDGSGASQENTSPFL